MIRDLKLGLQVVSKPPALLVLFGRAFYHHRPQKFKLDLTLVEWLKFFREFRQHSLAAFPLRKPCFTYMGQKASEEEHM